MPVVSHKSFGRNRGLGIAVALVGAAALAAAGGCTGGFTAPIGNPDINVNVTTGPTIVNQTQTNEQDQTTDTIVDQTTDTGTGQSGTGDGGSGAATGGGDGDGTEPDDTDGGTDTGDDTTSTTAPAAGGISVEPDFYAIYDRILDTSEVDDTFNIHQARMSGDGTRVFVVNGAGDNNDRKGWVITDLASAGRTEFDLPDGAGQIRFMAASGDGSRAFFTSGYEDKIYKWENGTISTIDVGGTTGPGTLENMAISEAGDDILLQDGWNLWRVNGDGGGLALLIEAAAVPTANGTGYRVWDTAVDDSGDVIAFLLYIRGTAGDYVELFVWNAGTITQLTDDRSGYKEYVRISGDGSRIVYQDQAADQYVTISSSGTGRQNLAPAGHNFGGMALDRGGTFLIYDDSQARGGRRIDLATGDAYEIMPNDIVFGISDQLGMSGDGSRIMFMYIYSTHPLGQSVYVGYFDDPDAVADAPRVFDAHLNPGELTSGATVLLDCRISDAEGADDIVDTGVDELAEGIYIGSGAESPASFYDAPNDSGQSGDATAGDGRYSCRGGAGGRIDDYDSVTLRIGVQDAGATIVVADVTLPIGH